MFLAVFASFNKPSCRSPWKVWANYPTSNYNLKFSVLKITKNHREYIRMQKKSIVGFPKKSFEDSVKLKIIVASG